MSLLLTAITDKGIIFAADRNIGRHDRVSSEFRVLGNRRKVFQVEHLDAAVGYVGVAEVGFQKVKTDEWLIDLIAESRDSCTTLEEFVELLRQKCTESLTRSQKKCGMGLHVAGYHDDLAGNWSPDFWWITNSPGIDWPHYQEGGEKFVASEDFWRRDVQPLKPSDGPTALNKRLREKPVFHFNGEQSIYLPIKDNLDPLFKMIRAIRNHFGLTGFNVPSTLEAYARLYRFHIDLTAQLYELFSGEQSSPIGGGVDVLTISSGGTIEYYPPDDPRLQGVNPKS